MTTRKANKNGDSDEDCLGDRIAFSEDKLMDSDSKAIVVAWEKPLIEAHVKAVCSGGGHVWNIGFEMGHEQHGFWHISECNMEI